MIVVKVAVDVGMRVGQRSMGMDMSVFFPGNEEDPKGHEDRCRAQGPCEGFPEH
jgi:hypothetical protein